jgi:mono/diheme cytochrome c family protein
MARRKDKRRRPRPTSPQPPEPTPASAPEDLIPAELREEAPPERLRAAGGTAPMMAFLVVSAAVVGLLLSGWTPRSVETGSVASGSPAPSAPGTTAPTPPAPIGGLGSIPPKNIFGAYCGICHALAAVGSVGIVGPDLDELRPTRAEVLRAIKNGGRRTGQMPPGILRGKTAERVAAYVASVAG